MKCLKILLAILFSSVLLNAQPIGIVYQKVDLFNGGRINLDVQNKKTPNVFISVNVPDENITLNLRKVDILSDNFSVINSNDEEVESPPSLFYQGKIEGDDNSIATISILDGTELVCSYSNLFGNFEITGKNGDDYLVRLVPELSLSNFKCFTTEPDEPFISENRELTLDCRSIQIYFEADYKLYQDKGSSIQNTINYVTSLFNQVSTLYNNEQIVIQISQIKVWDSPDPYIPYTNTSTVLNKFRTQLNGMFNGNLAHLLSTRSLGGGIAFIDVLCTKQYAVAVSSITTTFQSVPTYSWSVEVVTHEMGHNIGSWHTHSCNWPGGALDNCYSPEGSCQSGPPPIGGGTIMSYCHLTNYGINLSKGFGPVPGNYIRSKYNGAACLSGTNGSIPTNLYVTNVTETTAVLNWNFNNVQNYTLQYKSINDLNWITINVGNNLFHFLDGLTANTMYQWRLKTDCSQYSDINTFTTFNGQNCNINVIPSFTNIASNSVIIQWPNYNNVSWYALQYRPSTSQSWIEISPLTNNNFFLNGLLANTVYYVRLRPNCTLPFGTISSFQTLSEPGTCQPPTNLNTYNIMPTSVYISWNKQTFATSYNLQIKFPGFNNFIDMGSFTTIPLRIIGLTPGSVYQWRVKNQCSSWSEIASFTTPTSLNVMDDYTEKSVKILQPSDELNVFPNPTSGSINVINHTGSIELFDITGKFIQKFNDDYIDVSHLSNGMYILKINNFTFKIVKM